MFGIGMQELLLILIVVLLIFGANKLPEIGGGWDGPSEISAGPRPSLTRSTSPPARTKSPPRATMLPKRRGSCHES